MNPRLGPRDLAKADDATRDLLARLATGGPGSGEVLNVFATVAHHPDLLRAWLRLGTHLLLATTLAPRDRELVILRTAWTSRCAYEWGQHVVIARREGIDDDEIIRIAAGPDAPDWSGDDAILLTAVDELVDRADWSEPTWRALAARFDPPELLDLLFCIGHYRMLAGVLNACRVERDDPVADVPLPPAPDA